MIDNRHRSMGVKVFAGFFLIMALCTVISRSAASLLVAQVEVGKTSRGKLSYTYEGTGTIVPLQNNQIFLWSGQQVEYAAAVGCEVKAGECLVLFRMEYLEEKIEEKKSELKQLRLQKKRQEVEARASARIPAAESAGMTLAKAQESLQSAEDALAQANIELETFSKKKSGDSEEKQELLTAIEQAKEAYEAALQEVNAAQDAYELAVKEDEAQEKNDADAREAAQLGIEETRLQIKTAKKELKELKEYKKAEGKICADGDCVVMESNVSPGDITAGTEVIVTGSGGFRFAGVLSDENKSKIKAGDEAQLQLGGDTKAWTVKIEAVESQKTADSGNLDTEGSASAACWYADVPETIQAENGAEFSWKVETTTEQEYEQTIPLTALREGTDGAYCLIVSEKTSMLGTVQIAKKMPMTVLAKDSEKAAVTSALTNIDEIIVSSDSYVEEGDRIRLKE